MPKAKTVGEVIAGEAASGTYAQRYSDMTHIASTIAQRAAQLGVTPAEVVSRRSEYNAYGKDMPGGTAALVGMAERAMAEVQRKGPITSSTFYATPAARGNLPPRLKRETQTSGHQYFSDPENRAIFTQVGLRRNNGQPLALREATGPYRPTTARQAEEASMRAFRGETPGLRPTRSLGGLVAANVPLPTAAPRPASPMLNAFAPTPTPRPATDRPRSAAEAVTSLGAGGLAAPRSVPTPTARPPTAMVTPFLGAAPEVRVLSPAQALAADVRDQREAAGRRMAVAPTRPAVVPRASAAARSDVGLRAAASLTMPEAAPRAAAVAGPGIGMRGAASVTVPRAVPVPTTRPVMQPSAVPTPTARPIGIPVPTARPISGSIPVPTAAPRTGMVPVPTARPIRAPVPTARPMTIPTPTARPMAPQTAAPRMQPVMGYQSRPAASPQPFASRSQSTGLGIPSAPAVPGQPGFFSPGGFLARNGGAVAGGFAGLALGGPAGLVAGAAAGRALSERSKGQISAQTVRAIEAGGTPFSTPASQQAPQPMGSIGNGLGGFFGRVFGPADTGYGVNVSNESANLGSLNGTFAARNAASANARGAAAYASKVSGSGSTSRGRR